MGTFLTPSKAYLACYNLVCAYGWALVLSYCLQAISQHRDPLKLWENVEIPLKIVQTAAVLEIVHAATGLVRSNVFSTFLQVFSRVGILWGVVNISHPSRENILLIMMITSWAIVEIPRYLYYVASLVCIAMPPSLHFCRYHLFMVLYPTGITGEVGCLWSAIGYFLENQEMYSVSLPNTHNLPFSFSLVLIICLLAYVPGSPFMYSHMLAQRRSANRKFNTENKFIGSTPYLEKKRA